MILPIAITFIALLLLAAFLPTLWKRLHAYRAWKSDLKSIHQWARIDEFEQRRGAFVSSICERWPEAVVVNLLPSDPISYEERVDFAEGRTQRNVLLRVFRARPAAVHITLGARQHKMQICDARALNIPVTVIAAPARQPRAERPGQGDAPAATSPTRHGRRDERRADSPGRSNSSARS